MAATLQHVSIQVSRRGFKKVPNRSIVESTWCSSSTTVYFYFNNTLDHNLRSISFTMAFLKLGDLAFSPKLLLFLPAVILAGLLARIVYNLYFHPLAKYHGPWYARSFSLFDALISVRKVENHWLMDLTRKYGTDEPIRIAPNMLLFPKPSSLKGNHDVRLGQRSLKC